MMRLNNAHSIDLQIVIFKSCAHQAPDTAQIPLSILRRKGGFIPAVIKLHCLFIALTYLTRRVILRWRGDSDKHPDVTLTGRITLNPGDSVHQFHTTDFWV
ncbi:hypothetical protein D3C78_1499160 [compost metagenome]